MLQCHRQPIRLPLHHCQDSSFDNSSTCSICSMDQSDNLLPRGDELPSDTFPSPDENNTTTPRRRRRGRRRMTPYSLAPTSAALLIAVHVGTILLASHPYLALQVQRLPCSSRRTARRPTSSLRKGRDGYNNHLDGSHGSSGGVGDANKKLCSSSSAPAQPLTELIVAPGSTRTALLASSSRSDKHGGGSGSSGGGDKKRRGGGRGSGNGRSGGTSMNATTVVASDKIVSNHPLVRDMDVQRRDVLRYLLEQDLHGAFQTIEEMVFDVGQMKIGGADDEAEAKDAASAIVDETMKALTEVAFASPSRRGKNAADRIALGINALHLQVSPQMSLSHPYDAVPRATWIKALRALTGMRDVKRISLHREGHDGGSRFTFTTTPADASFGVLQRLVTGFGVRSSALQEGGKYTRASAAQDLDERDFSMVLNAFVNSGRMDMAHRVVALQERTETAPPLSPVAYSIMIKGYGKLQDADNIEMMLSHARTNRITPDTIMYNSLIDAYVNCNMVDKAHKAFTALTERSRGDMTSMPTPNIRSYNTMLKGYATNGNLRKALELSRVMDSAGLWNEVTTNTLVKAAVVAKEFVAAEDILNKFTAKGATNQGSRNKKRGKKQRHPNIQAYTDLIDGYGKARMLDRALATFKVMRQRGVEPNEYTYTSIVSAMARDGKIDEASKLLDVMQSDGVEPTVVTYNAFIGAMLENAPAPTSSPSEIGPDSFVSEDHTVYNERIVDSLRLLGRIVKSNARPNVRPNAITVSTIVEGLGKCHPARIEEAKSIVRKLDRDGKVSRQNERVGTALIHACGDNGDFQGSLDAFHDIAEPDIIALNAFLDACCKCDELKTALHTFDSIIAGTENRRSRALRPDVISYTILISALLKLGTHSGSSRAHKLYDEMKSWGIKPDISLVDVILSAMVGGGSLGIDAQDISFTRKILRDAEGLGWAPGQLEEKMQEVRFLLFGRMSEVWKKDEAAFGLESLSSEDVVDPLFQRKGWNKVDSGFRLWGGGFDKRLGKREQLGDAEDDGDVDEFLEAHGWNDVDSGFRLF